MGDRLVDAVDDGDRDLHRQVFAAQVGLVGVEMHRHARVLQGADQPRQGLPGDRGVDQQRLGGIAHAGPTGLGVQHDPFGHLEVGGVVDVDMAVADTGLDGRHLCVADHRIDQACSPARDHHVDQAAGLDQVRDACAVGGREQLNGVGGQVLINERIA